MKVYFALCLAADPGEGGTVSGPGTYCLGEEIPIEATAHEGWAFAAWTGDTLHTDDPLASQTNVTMPAGDVTLTASFASLPLAEGTVTDLLEGHTLAGAYVGVYCPDWEQLRGEALTNSQGHYHIRIKQCRILLLI